MKRIFLLILFVLSITSVSWCTAYTTCTNISSGNWNADSTWALAASPSTCNLVVVPTSSDTAVCTNGFTLTVSDAEAASTYTTSGSCNTTIANGGTLTTTTTFTTAGTGTVTVATGGDLEVGTILTLGTGTSMTSTGRVKYGDESVTAADQFLLNGTATFTCSGAGYLLAGNNMLQQKGSAANFYGTCPIIFYPNGGGAGSVSYLFRQSGTGSGSPIQRYCEDSSCTDTTATSSWNINAVTCNTKTSGQTFNGFSCTSISTGAGQYSSGGGGLPWNLIAHHSHWLNLGSTTVQGVNGSFTTNTLSGDYFDISGLLVDASGEFLVSGTVAQLHHITGLIFANCLDTSNSHRCGSFSDSAGWTTGSTFHDNGEMISPFTTTTTMWSTEFNVKGFTTGSSIQCGDTTDVPSFSVYNGTFDISGASGQNITIKNFMGVAVTNGTSTTSRSVLTGSGGNGYTDCMTFGAVKLPDGWPLLFNLAGGAGGGNSHKYDMVDGYSYIQPADSADALWDSGAGNTWSNFLVFNGGGTLDCLDSTATCTIKLGTYLDSWQLKLSHGAQDPNAITGIFGNAFIGGWGNSSALGSLTDQGWWFDDSGNGIAQNCTNCVNYNLMFDMQGSGDPGAIAHLSGSYPLMTNATLNTSSYVQPGLRVIATKAGVSAFTTTNTTNDTFNGATGLFTGTQVGDEVCDTTQKNLHCQTITLINSSSSAVMTLNPGWVTTDTFTTRPGPLAAQIYGTTSGAGNLDYHFDPQIMDRGANSATWNISKGGVGIGSSNLSNYPFVGSTGIGPQQSFPCTVSGNSVTMTGATLTTWNVGSSDYVMGILSPNVVGFAKVASVGSQTTLTTATNIGNTATYCYLVTDAVSLGTRLMAQSGWTLNSTGAVIATTPTTGYDAADLYRYMWQHDRFANAAACGLYQGQVAGGGICFPAPMLAGN